ncbi:MAG: cysteine synthase CysM [Gammaproteobacteria bacterium]|jgi:S-sulfo-L-cysteine synthase (O-acetyl-L-serine-dependent)|nr:cysteine synthase CysM [Gammaproteobacteria bacterium]|tara:strand:+ start:235 stop:1122 length:888 start_codon:yes stop_codon:yes gene_type:complete
MEIKNISSLIGNTPLVSLQRLNKTDNKVFLKMEGDNPAGSVKDRAAMNMVSGAEKKGQIKPGDTIIEATSGNTGIALAMVCAIKGYDLILIMPDNMSLERRAAMLAYGAKIILVTEKQGMEGARDLAIEMQEKNKGLVLNQFANNDNVEAHYKTTGPEIWKDTKGKVTHFVASMGTTGTIVGTAKYLKSMNPKIKIIGVQPEEGASIPGIRKWPKEYVPKIFSDKNIDEIIYISQDQAENTARNLAKKEGIFSGPSSGGTTFVALEIAKKEKNAVIVSIICDRGDRYISTGIFNK